MAQSTQNPRNSFPAWRLPNGLTNATDAQLDSASSACERWEWGCAGIVVVAVLGEFLIAGIHPSYDSFLEQWGTAMADAAIAIGIVGEVLFGRMDARIQTELRTRSNKKLAEAERETALIKARVEPRVLSAEQQSHIAARISEFSGQPIRIAAWPPGQETEIFMRQIDVALTVGGWKSTHEPQARFQPLWPGGVLVSHSADEKSTNVATCFAQALREAGVFAVQNSFSSLPGMGPLLFMTVGPKPSPEDIAAWGMEQAADAAVAAAGAATNKSTTER
jgi:hypothetical protein